jgi:cytochrome P450
LSKLRSIEHELNPFTLYDDMREEQPVYYDPERGNWSVFRYDDVFRVLSEYKTFSSQFAGESDSGEPFSASMIASDPPRHRKLRGLVTQAFTPKAVANMAPRIKELVKEYLDGIVPQGRMDVIADLGYPLPVIVIAEMMGIPTEDRDQFKRWSDVVVTLADLGGNVNQEAMNNPAILEMSAYFFNLIEQRQQEPGDDLISGLLQANIDGETLGMIDLLGFCALLLVAGNETTTNLIGNAMLAFTEHPERWERLRGRPENLPLAIEEALRYYSPVQSMFRITKTDACLSGAEIPAGSAMVAWIGSANRDESQFPQANRFDIARNPNKHLAFGQGIHYCLGAPLARLEAEIALGEMLRRFRSVERVQGVDLEKIPSLIVYGVKSLPITFEL